jgi:hypothetical protein
MSRTPFIRIIAFETAKLLGLYIVPSSPEASLFFIFKINHVRRLPFIAMVSSNL